MSFTGLHASFSAFSFLYSVRKLESLSAAMRCSTGTNIVCRVQLLIDFLIRVSNSLVLNQILSVSSLLIALEASYGRILRSYRRYETKEYSHIREQLNIAAIYLHIHQKLPASGCYSSMYLHFLYML